MFELCRCRGGADDVFEFREDMAARLMRDMISAVHYLHSKVGMRPFDFDFDYDWDWDWDWDWDHVIALD